MKRYIKAYNDVSAIPEVIEPNEAYSIAKQYMSPEEIDHHESDLYLKVTPVSSKIIEGLRKSYPDAGRMFISTFISNIEPHDRWYEVAFAYPGKASVESSTYVRANESDDFQYYEIGLGDVDDPDFRTDNYEETYSIAIKSDHYPEFDEVERFLADDISRNGFTGVNSITPLDEWEVHKFFDDSNIDNWPILKKNTSVESSTDIKASESVIYEDDSCKITDFGNGQAEYFDDRTNFYLPTEWANKIADKIKEGKIERANTLIAQAERKFYDSRREGKEQKWVRTELNKEDADQLKYYLKKHNIYYEPSLMDDGWIHFEVKATDEEVEEINKFLESLDEYKIIPDWNLWIQ